MLANIGVLGLCSLTCGWAFRESRRNRYRSALLLIVAAGLVLRVHAASDRCLHMWDERFHALVAKNLIHHPLTPTLFENPVLPYDFRNWTANHVWLEKGPVPLWALSGSIRVFGADELAVRLPSLLVSLLSVYLTFLIAATLFDRDVAILAAFFHAINGLLVELAAGRVSSDHVDTFFLFFIELGIYLSVRFLAGHRHWSVPLLIGMATGIAAMCKWFPALIVFPVWIAGLLMARQEARRWAPAILLALGGCLVVVGPYLIYVNAAFPQEASWIFRKYLLAFTTSVDEHTAPAYYYVEKIGIVFGELVYVALLFGLFEIGARRADWKIGIVSVWWALPLLLFSFAATKRFTYLLIAAPAIFIVLSYYWRRLYGQRERLGHRWAVNALLVLLVAFPVRYSIDRITPFENRLRTPRWSPEVKRLKDRLGPQQRVVVFNVEHNIEAMFYSGVTIYDFMPDQATIDRVTRDGYHVVINDDGRLRGGFQTLSHIEVLKLVEAGER
jgi:4-amino-4-deoxy-L-arabinose transferase-like glycosyltransferase